MLESVIDFETASYCDLKKAGAWRYAEDISTEVLCLGYTVPSKIGNIRRQWVPGDDLLELHELAANPEIIFVAHNAGFEKAIWRTIMVPLYGLPDIPNSRWDDTMAACAMRAIPLDLDRSTLVLRLENNKDKEASNFTKRLSRPNRKGYYDRSSESLNIVYKYNDQDLLAEAGLRKRLGPLPPGERNVWLLDQRINERGILLDADFIRQAQRVVDSATIPLIEEFKQITGGLKPTQVAKFKNWIYAQGVWIDNLSKDVVAALLGEESEDDGIDDAVLKKLEEITLPPHVRRALSIRALVGSASVKKLKRMDICMCYDGRVRGTMQYHGAGPGRWAGRLFQPHNFPRGTVKDAKGDKFDPEYLVNTIMTGDHEQVEMMVGPAVESVVSSLRHAILAAKGKILLSGDFAGVEARLVLAASGQHDKTAIMAAGQDIYCDMGSAIHKRPINKKTDPEERQDGKNAVLGLGFGMGWWKFKIKYAEQHSEDFCKEIIRIYRKEWAPCVPKMWYALEEAALSTVKTGDAHESFGVLYQLEDRWLTARLPSGRRLWYFNPQVIKKAMPWDETDIRIGFNYQAMKTGQWKTIDAFGGLLTENVIQGLARDLMVEAMFKLEKNGFPIILTVHDEIVCEPMAKDADEKAFQQIMSEIPAWAKKMQVPIAVETWKGDRYKK